ncbi:hypothetical protein L1987_56381 [Smallanthus sonchifolius]|uniref:Uncharacterized protein n=1 Tax=Smallanthus sonchifolius TaxID=185202 RepID=A0ACB9ED22_9ASTR|nr:hypothetical protein L1987_56381 [Smallanthus sonchifolius]
MADEFRRSQFELWSKWFSRLYAWEGDPGEFKRLAWIVVKGITVGLWDRHVVGRIGERVGILVQKSEANEEDGNISQDKLAVLVKQGSRIAQEFVVSCNGHSFRVWVDEMDEGWVPSFLLPASSILTPVDSAAEAKVEVEGIRRSEEPAIGTLHGLHEGVPTEELVVLKECNNDVVVDPIGETFSALDGSTPSHERKRFTTEFSNQFVQSDGDLGKRPRSATLSPAEVESTDRDDGVRAVPSVIDVEKEVEETIAVGEIVGIVMEGFQNQIRKLVQGEMGSSRSR